MSKIYENADNLKINLSETQLNIFKNYCHQMSINAFEDINDTAFRTKMMFINAIHIFSEHFLSKSKLSKFTLNYPEWFSSFLEKLNDVEIFQMDIKSIYSLSHYSPSMLIKYFKSFTGKTLVEYINEMKINYACSLLETSNYTTLTIAEKIGFYSLSHFNHLFKKQTGFSPREYCKKYNAK